MRIFQGYAIKEHMFDFWKVADNPPHRTDCFMVLSYCVENKTMPTKPTQAIIRLAYHWWKKHPHAYVIMSTGDNQGLGIPNSEVMVSYGIQIGIPKEKLIEENRSWNTVENLLYSEKIADAHLLHAYTLVTYDLHTRRTIAIARKLGWKKFHWVSAGSPGSPAFGIKAIQTYSRITIFFYEILAYGYNIIRGQIDPTFRISEATQ